jgi:hypothetical protein
MKSLIILFILIFSLNSFPSLQSQDINIIKDKGGYSWVLKNYNLPEEMLSYRIFYNDSINVQGGDMEYSEFYFPKELPSNLQSGIYTIKIYNEDKERILKVKFKIP